MKSFFSVLFLCCFFILPLTAAYLTDVPQEITQPDGTIIQCFASGDEYHNWLHDSDNYTIIQDQLTGYYTYAQKVRNKLLPSQYIVGKTIPYDKGLLPGFNISKEEYIQKRNSWDDGIHRDSRAPTSGIINNLVVFIRFSDQTEFTNSLSGYSNMFNNPAPNTNSMYNYFVEDSYQALSITTTFYPIPINHLVVSYQDSLPRNYYLPFSTTNPTGYNDSTERREREHTLLVNAIQFISTMVPPALDLDLDNDGNVDNVCFIVKGSSGAWADLLWPHKWSLYTYEVFLSGARVYTYNLQLENSLNSSGVGVLCHEMSHSIGFPDLYHYTSSGVTPIGKWDLMESNQNPPQHHTAYMKSRYGNWLPPLRQITQPGTYWVNKLLNRQDNCYKIASTNPQYFYVVEFRKKVGFFESSIPGTGLLVYRVDNTEAGTGNADGPPDELYAYRPGGTNTVNGTITSAHYSLETGRTAINATTNPTPFLSDGLQGGLNITQIGSSAGDSISFNITLPESAPTDYDEGFESGDFADYPWVLSGDSLWTITDSIAYEGTYCAKSGNIDHNQSSSISMTLDVPTAGFIAFYKKVYTESGNDFLYFYIDNIQKGQWSGNKNWTYVQFPVTQGSHEFRWSYIKDEENASDWDCVWLDNILFRWSVPTIHLSPENFQAQSDTLDIAINLSWQRPLSTSSSLSGYRIFKNNVQIADVDTTQLNYIDFNVIPSMPYSYFIKAFYSNPDGHSLATDTLDVIVTNSPLIPYIISADIVDTNSVILQWMVPSPSSGVIGYYIYRNGNLVQTINETTIMQWTDEDLDYGQYSYQMASRYLAFDTVLSDSMTVVIENIVSDSDYSDTPLVFGLGKTYPNPFVYSTQIHYSVDKDNTPIDISIYNIKGQKVKTLLHDTLKKGIHKIDWNGMNDEGKQSASGVYFCRMHSSSRTSSKKLLLLK